MPDTIQIPNGPVTANRRRKLKPTLSEQHMLALADRTATLQEEADAKRLSIKDTKPVPKLEQT